MSGIVKSNTGDVLPGASVMVVHKPTGSVFFYYGLWFGYSVQGLRPGGPYTVTVTYVGFKTTEITEINAP
jgi:hypothetical protein